MIQLDKSYFDILDKDKIQYIINKAKPYFEHRKKLYKRYSRKSGPNELMSGTLDADGKERTPVTFEYYSVNMVQGYLSGKPPTYTVSSVRKKAAQDIIDKYQEEIDFIRRYNDDGATFTELIHDYIITAAAYLYITENENNEIVYTRLDSRNTICIYDYGTPPYPIALIKIWIEGEGNEAIEKIEIITDKSRRILTSDGHAVPFTDYDDNGVLQHNITEKTLYWGDVPVAAFEHPDSIAIFEPDIGLIDTFENITTNTRNMTQYNDNAKLLISGYSPENTMFIDIRDKDGNPLMDNTGNIIRTINPAWKQEEKELYEASAVFLNGEGSEMKWLIKDVSYDGILSLLRFLLELITMITGVPDMTDTGFTQGRSGRALGYKLYSLDQYAALADRIFKKGYLRVWEIITNRINLTNNTSHDFRDINIAFSRNIPTDKAEKTEVALKAFQANGISLETFINESGFEIDAEAEVVRVRDGFVQTMALLTAKLITPEEALSRIYNIPVDKAKKMLPDAYGDD
jgi:SPP1 family phage portal protein